jgi:hypothetical protein
MDAIRRASVLSTLIPACLKVTRRNEGFGFGFGFGFFVIILVSVYCFGFGIGFVIVTILFRLR